MLALSIISTVILGVLILVFFGICPKNIKSFIIALILNLLLGSVIIAIWILYMR